MVNGKSPSNKRKKRVSPSHSGAIVTRPLSVVDLKAEIDKLATEYMSSARNLSSEEKLALLKQIQEAYGKCKEFGDDKVQLAMQTYEMVWPCSWLPTYLPSIPQAPRPLLQPCWDLFWVWEIYGILLTQSLFTGTNLVRPPFPSFPPRWTNTSGGWTQTWPVLRLI